MKTGKALALTISLLGSGVAYAANPPYSQPAGDAGQLSHITGSLGETASKKPSAVYVWGIDRKEVDRAEKNWQKPVAVTPGIHKVTVALKGVYQEFDVDFCAGCTFKVHASYSEESSMMFKYLTSELWITRVSDGQEITDRRAGKPTPVKVSFQSF
ncbi:MAG: hypothetical protein EON58_09335 [Alphaproteobacteria bacterium]|nr:MAG: hypothetical protein EON58_09335 [Alphaproteobacteria bacterium]